MRIDYDGKWKILIEKTPQQFIEFFLPEIVPQINFQIPPKLMQQDVAKVIGSKRKKGDLVTDLIMEVCLLSGKKKLLYIHIEVQSTPTTAFGEKMFKPFYRLMDKYNQEVTALALFVGAYLPQNYDYYEYSFGKTLVRYEYPTYIVKNQDKEALKASKNPYAIAVLACQYLIATKNKKLYDNRLSLKKELIDFIIDAANSRGYNPMTSGAIIDFVLNIMILPEKLETHFINYCHQKYLKMENSDIIPGNTVALANIFSETFFKESYETVLQQLRDAKKDRAAKLKAEEAAKAAKLKAEKEAKAARLKTEKVICKLHFEQKLSSQVIALIVEETDTYVQSVIAKNKMSD